MDLSQVTPSGGSFRNCTPARIYAYVTVPEGSFLHNRPTWSFNSSSISSTEAFGIGSRFASPGGITISFYMPTTNNNGMTGPGTYTFKQEFDVGMAEGSVTITC